MKIYWIRAQAPRRVLALAKHLGIEAEYVEAVGGLLRKPEYIALNPNSKAPTLVDGDLVLWESSAIMAYLAIKAGSDMWPAHDPAEQVEVLRWLSWTQLPLVAPSSTLSIPSTSRRRRSRSGRSDRESLKQEVPELLRFAKILDAHLEGREYVACGRLTIADFQLASMATDWREAEMPLAEFTNIVRWLEGLERVPAWAEPWPEGRGEDRRSEVGSR